MIDGEENNIVNDAYKDCIILEQNKVIKSMPNREECEIIICKRVYLSN